MRLYKIEYDSQDYFVEAPSMQRAIELWHGQVAIDWGNEYEGDEEVDSCQLVYDSPHEYCVIREAP